MKTALLSVSDKTGLIEFANFLTQQNYQLLSTGGTYKHLQEGGIEVKKVEDITQFPEILDGRVKTLHPAIHGGILARRDKKGHMQTLEQMEFPPIDMVVVNLYPFFENANTGIELSELVEFIDIGGPTMLRAAAKSFFDVTVITDVADYSKVMEQITATGAVDLELRKQFAGKVFNLTSAYDAAIANQLLDNPFPNYYNVSYKKHSDLRYGENPHQKAAFFVDTTQLGALTDFEQLNGKELSFNNIRDLDIAWKVVCEFDETACCAVKHSTPCGVALDENLAAAYQKAHDCDPISIFGGIVAFNKTVNSETAKLLNTIFLEIVVAPEFEPEALEILYKKKNLRVLRMKRKPQDHLQSVKVDGGLLVQERDTAFSENFETVTNKTPIEQQSKDLIFAQKVIKHVKSNAIVVAHDQRALGVGTGETNRIWAAQQAIDRAKEKQETGLVLASDAFFPFRDVVDYAADRGIEAIVQPGGSIRDQESIDAANEHGIAMVLTHMRHFLH